MILSEQSSPTLVPFNFSTKIRREDINTIQCFNRNVKSADLFLSLSLNIFTLPMLSLKAVYVIGHSASTPHRSAIVDLTDTNMAPDGSKMF